jgi:glyoxylase-like metal-dependent hydrolase (beta-lactamase superfamily II)
VTIEPAADGVWLVRGGFPKRISNVYLIEDGGGVTLFDAGIRSMADGIRRAAASLGGIDRIVLGHAHEDHRGAAPGLGAPVWCHEDERAYAEDPLRPHTDYYDFSKIPSPLVRVGLPIAFRLFDGGPCRVERTLVEGERVAGFEVVHLPGHSPGQIALWREHDRVALTTDCFYTFNPVKLTLPFGEPRCTFPFFDHDHERARLSLRKLAEMEPAVAWPGHARPVSGDVRAQLDRAAARCGE